MYTHSVHCTAWSFDMLPIPADLFPWKLQDTLDTCSGWWFGCHFWHCPINIGFISSSQLTNSYFIEGFKPPTRIYGYEIE